MQRTTNQVNTIMNVDNEIHRIAVNDPSLTNLDLSSQNLSSNQIRALGEALSNNTRLRKLILNSNIIKNLPLLIAFSETFKNIIINNTNTSLEEIYFKNTSINSQNIIGYIKRAYPENSSLIQDWLLICGMLSKDTLGHRRSLKQWMNTDKKTALLTACELGLLPLVKQLIEIDHLDPNVSYKICTQPRDEYNSDDEDEYEDITPLGAVLEDIPYSPYGPRIYKQEVAKYLLTQKYKLININKLSNNRTPLIIACGMGDVNSVKLILSYPNVDTTAHYTHYPEELSYNALTEASMGYLQALESNREDKNNYKTIIRLLLEHYYTAYCLNLMKEGKSIQTTAIGNYDLQSDLSALRQSFSYSSEPAIQEITRLNAEAMQNAVAAILAKNNFVRTFAMFAKNKSHFKEIDIPKTSLEQMSNKKQLQYHLSKLPLDCWVIISSFIGINKNEASKMVCVQFLFNNIDILIAEVKKPNPECKLALVEKIESEDESYTYHFSFK